MTPHPTRLNTVGWRHKRRPVAVTATGDSVRCPARARPTSRFRVDHQDIALQSHVVTSSRARNLDVTLACPLLSDCRGYGSRAGTACEEEIQGAGPSGGTGLEARGGCGGVEALPHRPGFSPKSRPSRSRRPRRHGVRTPGRKAGISTRTRKGGGSDSEPPSNGSFGE